MLCKCGSIRLFIEVKVLQEAYLSSDLKMRSLTKYFNKNVLNILFIQILTIESHFGTFSFMVIE